MIRECRIPDPKRDPTISTDGLEPGLSTPCRTSVVPRSDAFPAGIRRTAVGLRRDCGKARCDVSPLSGRGQTGPGALRNMRGPTAVRMTQIRKRLARRWSPRVPRGQPRRLTALRAASFLKAFWDVFGRCIPECRVTPVSEPHALASLQTQSTPGQAASPRRGVQIAWSIASPPDTSQTPGPSSC
jgi:hypothetical protein